MEHFFLVICVYVLIIIVYPFGRRLIGYVCGMHRELSCGVLRAIRRAIEGLKGKSHVHTMVEETWGVVLLQ